MAHRRFSFRALTSLVLFWTFLASRYGIRPADVAALIEPGAPLPEADTSP